MALMCFEMTQFKYSHKYIFDFRDLGFEHNPLYRKIVKKVIDHSYFTCMSSPDFAPVFRLKDYVMAHNFRYRDLLLQTDNIKNKSNPIILLHIGITRGEDYNKKLAVYIIGSGNDTPALKEYIKKYDNIVVQGRYDNEQKAEWISKADMLLYCYPCSFNCNRALANKYYDGLIYKKPLIGNKNTYSGKRLEDKGLGISVDLDTGDIADKIYTYYANLDQDVFLKNVKKELDEILKEDELYIRKIEKFAVEC